MRPRHPPIVLPASMLGVGGHTFGYARGWSCLTDEPGACANCHLMHELYVRPLAAPGDRAAAR